jgi:hypothetical protein
VIEKRLSNLAILLRRMVELTEDTPAVRNSDNRGSGDMVSGKVVTILVTEATHATI